MANFSCKIAQVVLSLFCLTQTHIASGKDNNIELTLRAEPQKASNEYGFFASVKDVNDAIDCGAVWISDSTLLTAASCLDREGEIDLPNLKNSLIKIKVYRSVPNEQREYKIDSKMEMKGVAIAHPLFRRLKGMTIAYDLAVVRVTFDKKFRKNHTVGTLCKQDNPDSKLIALALDGKTVKEYELEKTANKYIAMVNDGANEGEGEEYFIDPRKQFTTHLNLSEAELLSRKDNYNPEKIFSPYGYGGPILDINNGRCILGIMNFAALKNEKDYYITSTNVTPIIPWIEYTKNYLRAVKGSILTKLYGASGMAFWRSKGAERDPIGEALPNDITPGEPVHKKPVTKKNPVPSADTKVRPEEVVVKIKERYNTFFPNPQYL